MHEGMQGESLLAKGWDRGSKRFDGFC
jgi:hypothetical protein